MVEWIGFESSVQSLGYMKRHGHLDLDQACKRTRKETIEWHRRLDDLR